MGKDMSSFFDKHIRGTELPDVEAIFAKIGVNVNVVNSEILNAGIRMSGDGTIAYLRPNSPAEKAGLSPEDEIISINDFRVTNRDAQTVLDQLRIGEKAVILYARDGVMFKTTITGETFTKISFRLSLDSDAGRNLLLRKFFRI